MRDGIYFNLPEEDYLSIERLSKSGLKRIRVSPADFWADSWLNPAPAKLTPDQEKRKQLARLLGRAYHCARLEPGTFHDRYVRELSQSDFADVEGFLSTGTAMAAKLEEMGLKKSGSVMEQARRLADGGFDPGLLWHLRLEQWHAERGGRVAIPAEPWDQILQDMERIAAVPMIHELLSGGEAEVSVLYTCPETGIPMKARFDYLRAGDWVEFKSFANPNGKHLSQCLTDALRFNRYHIDAVSYMGAAEAIRIGGLDIVGDATDEQINLITAIKERHDELACHFVFQQKGGVPNVLHRSFRFWDVPLSTSVNEQITDDQARIAAGRRGTRQRTILHTKGRMEIAAAKRDFLAYSEIYERGQPWQPFNPSGEFTDEDFSTYWLEETI